jgi:hypothetical protein
MARLVAVALAVVAAAVAGARGDGARRLGGHGVEIVSGDGSPGAPFNRPSEAGGDVRSLYAALGKHRADQLARLGSFGGGARRLQNAGAGSGAVIGGGGSEPVSGTDTLSNCPEVVRQYGANPFGNVTQLHPCYNAQCAVKRSGTVCIDTVFAFCCDEAEEECQAVLSADVLALRAQVSCTAQSCTNFMRTTGQYSPPAAPEPGWCPFSNRTVCDAPCKYNMGQIQSSWLWGDCQWNKYCFKNAILNYDSSVINARKTLGRVVAGGARAGAGRLLQETGGAACLPEMLDEAYSAALSARSCSGDLENTDCGTFKKNCMSALMTALRVDQTFSGPLVDCLRWQGALVPASAPATAYLDALAQAAPEMSLPAPENATYVRFLPDFIGKCFFGGSSEGGDNYGEGGDNYGDGGGQNVNFECDPRSLAPALSAALSVRGCSGDLTNADCGKMNDCMPDLETALQMDTLGSEPKDNPLISCLMWQSMLVPKDASSATYLDALAKAAPSNLTLPSRDSADYIRFLPGFILSCSRDQDGGDHSCQGPDCGCEGPNCGGHTGPWNYSKECRSELEGRTAQCGVGCCDVAARALAADSIGVFDFGGPNSSTFACGQKLASTGSSEQTLSCMRKQCAGCFVGDDGRKDGGMFGPPSGSEGGAGMGAGYGAAKCVDSIHAHCESRPYEASCAQTCPFQQCDSRKNPNCPCDDRSCDALYDGGFNVQGQCRAVREQLVRDYVDQGFFYPEADWARNQLESSLGHPLVNATGPFELSNATRALAAAKGCEILSDLVRCVGLSVKYCNSPLAFYSPECRALSSCGDGRVSWGETCDDGNANDFDDGCMGCSVSINYYCSEPGKSCEYCERDPNAVQQPMRPGQTEPEMSGCPFCMNKRLRNLTNPCFASECRVVEDYPSAAACDKVVEGFCGTLASAGLHDPGCDTYKPKSAVFAVPQIPACTSTFRTLQVGSKWLDAVRIVVIDCELVDPTQDPERNITPMVAYMSPLDGMSDSDLSSMDTGNKSAVRAFELPGVASGDLVPITALTDFETNPYFRPEIRNGGQPIGREWNNAYRRRVAWLAAAGKRSVAPPGFPADMPFTRDCDHPDENMRVPLIMLPACKDSTTAALRHVIEELVFRDVYNPWSDLFAVDIDAILDGLPCELPERANKVSFFAKVSNTYMQWVGGPNGGRVVPKEQPEFDNGGGNGGGGVTGTPAGMTEQAPTVEQMIVSGNYSVQFGKRLFQPGCADSDCEEVIAKCKEARINNNPALRVHKNDFVAAADRLEQIINTDLPAAASWAEVKQAQLTIAAVAASGPVASAMKLFDAVTVQGQVTKLLKDVKDYCPHDYWISNATGWFLNPEWKEDPCCNWELRAFMCCPVKDVPGAKVSTVTGFSSQLEQHCANPDLIKQTFRNLFTTLADSRKAAEQAAADADPAQFDRIWEFEQDCRDLINGEGKTIQSQADCYCEYSVYSSATTAGGGQCKTDEEDMPLCFANCFRQRYDEGENANPFIVHFLRQQWGIGEPISDSQVDENERFGDKWLEHVTEQGCAGPQSWHEDIGHAGYFWECNETCSRDHECSYEDSLQRVLKERFGPNDMWTWRQQLSYPVNETACTELNGTKTCMQQGVDGTCYGEICVLAAIVEEGKAHPCTDGQQCQTDCFAPCSTQVGCEAEGGTWYNVSTSGNGGQQCCPAGGYLRENGDWTSCSSVPPGKPNSWELGDEVCCRAEGGSWKPNEWGGSCCLGSWVMRQGPGTDQPVQYYCDENMNSWAQCQKCREETCEPMWKSCQTCQTDKHNCCGNVYRPQNESACMSYEGCPDRSIMDAERCDDPTPFCSNAWGWPEGYNATCTAHYWSQSDCENADLTWDNRNGRCVVENFPADGTIEQCFAQGGACPAKTFEDMYPGWEAPALGWNRRQQCDAGCRVPLNATHVTKFESGRWPYCSVAVTHQGQQQVYWASVRDGSCVIDAWQINNLADPNTDAATVCSETFSGSAWSSHTLAFQSARFGNEAECEAGYCEGPLNQWRIHPETGETLWDQPWSAEQCVSSPERQCDRWCPRCRTGRNQAGDGGCFSTDPTGEVMELDSTVGDNATCAAANKTWFNCPAPSPRERDWQVVDNVCKNDNSTVPNEVLTALQCSARWDRCETQEACDAVGDCVGLYGYLDLDTHICDDEGWAAGDRTWYLDENNTWHNCRSQRKVRGACIAPRSSTKGCGTDQDSWWKWHPLGCRTSGLHARDVCEAAEFTWYDPIENAAQCSQLKACQLNRWDVRQFGLDECTTCGGTQIDFARWVGGKWSKSYTRPLTWHAQGRVFAPVNKWIPRQQTWKLKEELAQPVMRSYAQFKRKEMLATYTAYRSVLETIICDCGDDNDHSTNCFADQLGGDLIGSSEVIRGSDVNPADGVTVRGTTPDFAEAGEMTRRRRLETDAAGPVIITVMSVSAGTFDKHTPCTGDSKLTFDTLAVQSATSNGLVVGQLIGNGKNLTVSGPFESALVCLPARLDINVRDTTFTTVGVAILRDDSKIVPLTFANDSIAYVERTKSQVCVEVNQSGVFFPILRVPDSLLDSTANCASPCAEGTCVLNSTGTAACLCKCGFSGTTCSSGCRDSCNDRGTCNAVTNVCSCTPGASKPLYTGDACQRTNCPVDANNNLCSNNGACVIDRNDAQCNCTAGFNGTACESPIVEETRTGDDEGFGVVQPVTDKASAGIKLDASPPTPAPVNTPAPVSATKSPVNAPVNAPVSATKSPVSAPTNAPVSPTLPPVSPTLPPVTPTAAVLDPAAAATITPTLLVAILLAWVQM